MIIRTMNIWTVLALTAILGMYSGAALADGHGTESKTKPSLYDRLGGLAPISVVVSDFIDELVSDPVMNQNPAVDAARTQVPGPYLKYHVTAQFCDLAGGPCQYHGKAMKASHSHLNITEAEWSRMVTVLKEVLAKYKVPATETNELLAIVDSTKAGIVSVSNN